MFMARVCWPKIVYGQSMLAIDSVWPEYAAHRLCMARVGGQSTVAIDYVKL